MTDDELRSERWDLIVVGRGFAGVTNCVTRLRSGALPARTLLVGHSDPWRAYVDHRMGQYPSLLALPGFDLDTHPTDCETDQFLSSIRFSEQTRAQLHRILNDGHLVEVDSVIEAPFTYVNDEWIIQLSIGGKRVSVRSKAVDVCTGPGPGRVFSPGAERIFGAWADGIRDSFDPLLLQELMDGVGSRAIIAESFMCDSGVPERVLIVGEGPLAASSVEHAIRNGCKEVVWVGRPLEMLDSFPVSMRYDALIHDADSLRAILPSLQSTLNSGAIPDISRLYAPMLPVDSRLTIILGCISKVQVPAITAVGSRFFGLVVLGVGNIDARSFGSSLPVLTDKLVISASSQNAESERMSAAHLLRSIPKPLATSGLEAISSAGMFAGLQAPNGSLRVLGAAARNPFLINHLRGTTAEIAYQGWHDSLCGQARMTNYAMGITVAGATIAMANDFYCFSAPDLCAQTTRQSGGILGDRPTRREPFRKPELASTPYAEFPRSG